MPERRPPWPPHRSVLRAGSKSAWREFRSTPTRVCALFQWWSSDLTLGSMLPVNFLAATVDLAKVDRFGDPFGEDRLAKRAGYRGFPP